MLKFVGNNKHMFDTSEQFFDNFEWLSIKQMLKEDNVVVVEDVPEISNVSQEDKGETIEIKVPDTQTQLVT